MDIEKMTEALQAIIMSAFTKAQENHNSELCIEHIIASMLEDNGLDGIWSRLGIDKEDALKFTENYIRTTPIHRLLRWRGYQLQQAPLLGCGHRSHNRYRHCVFQQARFIFRDLGPEPRP